MKPKGSSTEPTTYAISIYWAQRKKETNRIFTFHVWSLLAITTVLGRESHCLLCQMRKQVRWDAKVIPPGNKRPGISTFALLQAPYSLLCTALNVAWKLKHSPAHLRDDEMKWLWNKMFLGCIYPCAGIGISKREGQGGKHLCTSISPRNAGRILWVIKHLNLSSCSIYEGKQWIPLPFLSMLYSDCKTWEKGQRGH